MPTYLLTIETATRATIEVEAASKSEVRRRFLSGAWDDMLDEFDDTVEPEKVRLVSVEVCDGE